MTNLIGYLFWRCWRWFYKGYVVLCRRNHHNAGIYFYCLVYKKNTWNIFHRKFAWGIGYKKWSPPSKSMWRWDLWIVFKNIQWKILIYTRLLSLSICLYFQVSKEMYSAAASMIGYYQENSMGDLSPWARLKYEN